MRTRFLGIPGSVVWLCALVLSVASPVAAGVANGHNLLPCDSCHRGSPRFGVDGRRDVTFTTSADDPGLCAVCHAPGQHPHPVLVDAGSGPAGAKVSTYLAAGNSPRFAGKVVCTSCHFLHAADGGHALLRGFPGTPDPHRFASIRAFCEECHGANLAPRNAHVGGERSCAFCHAGRPESRREGGVVTGMKDRCGLCHAGTGEEHYREVDPLQNRRDCADCHDKHATSAASPGLLSETYRAAAAAAVEIRPHYRRSLCFACHENTDDYALRAASLNETCDRCHGSGRIAANIHPLRQVPAAIKLPQGWPTENGALTCLTCHEQGHEDQERKPWMLRGGRYERPRDFCQNCHSMKDLQASRIHVEINEGKGCEMCHATRPLPGKDTIKTVTFIGDPNLLCLRCHDETMGDGSTHHGKVVGREIAEGQFLPEFPLYKNRIVCATCHDPHILEANGFRLRANLSGSFFCVKCHPI